MPPTNSTIIDAIKHLLKDEKPSTESYRRVHALLLKLYNHRCALCGGYASSIHEIEPRSSGLIAWSLYNMIPVCTDHHTLAHAKNMKTGLHIALRGLMLIFLGKDYADKKAEDILG